MTIESKKAIEEEVMLIKDEIDLVHSNRMIDILKDFDLTDSKSFWKENDKDNFENDYIIVVLKKTSLYQELELKDFSINIGVSLEYIGGSYPPAHFFDEDNEELLANYRQIVTIKVDAKSKDNIISAVRKLERINFIKQATPNIVETGGI